MKAKKNQNLFALILDKMGSWSLLILIGVVMAFANSKFLTSSNIINVLRQIAVVTIGAVGVSFVILGGGFDLSTGPGWGRGPHRQGPGLPERQQPAGGEDPGQRRH